MDIEEINKKLEENSWVMPRTNRNWLVSYPRSGNTWIRLFMEEYTGKSTRSDKTPVAPLKVHTKETIMWKEHEFPEKKDKTDKFVFLIRSPFNAIPSKLKFDGKDFTDENVLGEIIDYVALIRDYENLGFGYDKHIIYYEDLLTNFKGCIIDMLLFLFLGGIDIKKIDKFVRADAENYKTAHAWFRNVVQKDINNLYNTNDFNNRKSDLSEKQINIIRRNIKNIRMLRRYDGS